MASPWALERFGGLAGVVSKRFPQAFGAALERVLTRRHAARTATTEDTEDRRRRALRHVVGMSFNSNQGLLDTRWGDTAIADDRAPR
jgi:hypothetical protein